MQYLRIELRHDWLSLNGALMRDWPTLVEQWCILRGPAFPVTYPVHYDSGKNQSAVVYITRPASVDETKIDGLIRQWDDDVSGVHVAAITFAQTLGTEQADRNDLDSATWYSKAIAALGGIAKIVLVVGVVVAVVEAEKLKRVLKS